MPFSRLPLDQFGKPIPVLGEAGTPVNLTAGAASVSGALPANCDVVRVACLNDCYIDFGTSGVVAAAGTSMFMPKGAELFKVPSGATHIAVIQHTTGGVVSVAPMA